MNDIKCKWLEKEYDPSTYEHRNLLTDIILSYEPFESILDVGCCHGDDLFLLNLKAPNKFKMYGMDKEAGDLNRCKANLPDGEFKLGTIQEILKDYPDKSIDIVFTNGVWMYVDPHYFNELKRIAKKAVIMSEKNTAPLNNYNPTKITKVTKEVRDTWKDDGYIFEFDLRNKF